MTKQELEMKMKNEIKKNVRAAEKAKSLAMPNSWISGQSNIEDLKVMNLVIETKESLSYNYEIYANVKCNGNVHESINGFGANSEEAFKVFFERFIAMWESKNDEPIIEIDVMG